MSNDQNVRTQAAASGLISILLKTLYYLAFHKTKCSQMPPSSTINAQFWNSLNECEYWHLYCYRAIQLRNCIYHFHIWTSMPHTCSFNSTAPSAFFCNRSKSTPLRNKECWANSRSYNTQMQVEETTKCWITQLRVHQLRLTNSKRSLT